MDRSKYQNLVASAFRIYLMYILEQTEDLLRECKVSINVTTPGPERSNWHSVVESASLVLTYIKNCQNDDRISSFFVRGLHGLSIIAAAQDSLASLHSRAETNHAYLIGTYNHHAYIAQVHKLRAKCIVLEMLAQNQDLELTAIWEKAAQHLHQHSQMIRDDAGTSRKIAVTANQIDYLVRKGYLDPASCSAEVLELRRRATRHDQFHHAYAILNRETNHNRAAHTFEIASGFAARAEKGPPATAKLWSCAVSTMRLAAEMIETQVLDCVQDNEPAIACTIDEAKRMVARADEALFYVAELERMKVKHSHTLTSISQNKSTVLPARQILESKQRSLCATYESHLNHIISAEALTTPVSEYEEQFRMNRNEFAKVSEVVDELEQSVNSAQHYSAKAVQCNHIQSAELRAMYKQCWSRAADEMAELVNAISEKLTVTSESSYSNVLILRERYRSKASKFASCANEDINKAVRYQNAARGAAQHGADRDLREMEWWNTAAESLQHAAKFRLEDLEAKDGDRSLFADWPEQEVHRLREKENTYATAADYLGRAFHLKAQQPQAAMLYTQAAEMLVATQHSAHPAWPSIFVQAVQWCMQLIDDVTNMSKIATEEKRALLQRGCDHAHQFCQEGTTTSYRISATVWYHAVKACFDADKYHTSGNQDGFKLCVLRGALFASAAQLYTREDSYRGYMLCIAAAVANPAEPSVHENQLTGSYRLALIKRLCSKVANWDSAAVQAELQQFSMHELSPDAEVLLNHHAWACEMYVESSRQLMLLPHRPDTIDRSQLWRDASKAGNDLMQHYTARASNGQFQFDTIASEKSEMLKLMLQCYMAAAEGESLAVWDTAVKLCRDAERTHYTYSLQAPTSAIKRAMKIAESISATPDLSCAESTDESPVSTEAPEAAQNMSIMHRLTATVSRFCCC